MMNGDAPIRVVVLDPVAGSTADRLRALLPAGFELACATDRGEAHLRQLVTEADFAIAGQVPVSGDVLRAAGRLRLLHKWGVGVDNLDLAAARELGIKVARTTGSNAQPVAEFTLGLMLAAMRNLAFGHAELQKGHWRGSSLPTEPLVVSGRTVGLVGLGAIGQRVARLLGGFDCQVLYYKRTPLTPSEEAGLGVAYRPLADLLVQADIVSLHCPLTEETRGLIDRAALASMKRSAVLVNVARGGVVVDADLCWALENKLIHAAATDVYEVEPLPADSPLLKLPNLVTTPHLAALAADTFVPTVMRMFDNFQRILRNEPIPVKERVVD